MTKTFKWDAGDVLEARNSGKPYRVLSRCDFEPRKFNPGEVVYHVVGLRNGERFGPVRLMRESAFNTFRVITEPAAAQVVA